MMNSKICAAQTSVKRSADRTIDEWNNSKIGKIAGGIMMLSAVATSMSPVFASGDIKSAYVDLANTFFQLIQSLFGVTCCVVVLVSLFLMLIATDDRGVQSGIHRIKIAVACLVIAYLVPFIIQKILDALKGNNSTTINNLDLPT
ncbi:hypothetical protein ACTQZS_08355 [Bilifractor sp. LCP19S3_H10]|uniref:hypothetical protein n=1 Tax=Bilifractor sp. LCP19S3_H10 TaxID=3438736 RepID=UPI003F8F29C6